MHTTTRRPAVRLLEADPELGHDLSDADAAAAGRALVAPLVALGTGAHPIPATRPAGITSLLVLSGLIVEETRLGNVTHARVLGPGDVVDPWNSCEIPVARRWEAATRVRAAALSGDLLDNAARWPSIGRRLLERASDVGQRADAHATLLHLPNVRERLLAVLWCLAQRFGRVVPGGLVIALPLSHSRLGHLAGARRPTVTLALADLAQSGLLERREEGWFISDAARPVLTQIGLEPLAQDLEVAA